jgi:hypothetical protein
MSSRTIFKWDELDFNRGGAGALHGLDNFAFRVRRQFGPSQHALDDRLFVRSPLGCPKLGKLIGQAGQRNRSKIVYDNWR